MIRRLLAGMCFFGLTAGALHAQARKSVVLEVRGLTTSLALTAAEFAALPRHTLNATAHGVTNTFSGVSLTDLLHLVSAPSGASLRGKELTDCVVVDARDGYRVVFSLAEFDAEFTGRVAILADHIDGKVIDTVAGPLHLVVPDEKVPARWVRQVTSISLTRAAP